jgi:hypothetical protein
MRPGVNRRNPFNRIGSGKRVDFCVALVQVFEPGLFWLSIGAPSSYGILQTEELMRVLI